MATMRNLNSTTEPRPIDRRTALKWGAAAATVATGFMLRGGVAGATDSTATIRLIDAEHRTMSDPSATSLTRDALVFGQYVPGPETTGPILGTAFKILGTGPSYRGQHITSYDDLGCPRQVANAADWSNGSDYRLTVTSDGQVIENVELWGSIDIRGHNNVVVRNCIIHGDAARSGYAIAPIINSSATDNMLGLLIEDTRFIGRPIRIPDTFNGIALDAGGRIDPCNQYSNGLRGGAYTIRRCEIVRQPDGIGLTAQIGRVNIFGCWIHRHAYVEWTTHDSSSGPGGWYPTAKGGSTYTHADAIQFHRGKHYRICGNTLGNYRGGAGSGTFRHNMIPSQNTQILACGDYYNSCFMIAQEVDSTLANQIQDVVIWSNFLGGSVATINWPSSTRGNPFPKRQALDNWANYGDPGIGIWHNRVRKDAGSALEFLIYPTWTDRVVDNVYDDGTPVRFSRSS